MRKVSVFGLAALFGLMVSTTMPARAQTIVSTDVGPSFDSSGQPVAGASGTFHVVITRESSTPGGTDTYQVTISGNADGVPGTPPPGTAQNPPAKSGIGRISLNFWDASGGTFASSVAAGSTNAYSGPANGNLGGPNNATFGTTGGTWSSSPGDTTYYSTTDKAAYVAPHGGNTFTGTFTLGPDTLGTDNVSSVSISLQDSGQQYFKKVNATPVIPEPGSLALLLPGLAPLGFMLRRRRRSSDEDEG